MAQELNYKVRFESDVSGLNQAASSLKNVGSAGGSSLDQLAMRGGSARQAIMGLQMASSGSATAILGVAQSVRALIMSLTAGNPILLLVMAAAWALSKGMEYLTGQHNKASEASKKSAEESKKFDDSIKGLLETQRKVTFSLDEQSKMLEAISGYYAGAAKAADEFAEAQKKVSEAQKSSGLAGVNLNQARGKLFNAGNPEATAKVDLQAARDKAAIEYAATQRNAEIEEQTARKKMDLSTKRLFALGAETGQNPEVGRAQDYLSGLYEQRKATAADTGPERTKLLTEIQQREKELVDLQNKDWDTRAKVNTEIEKEKRLLAEVYPAQLANLAEIKKAEADNYSAKQDEFTLQGKINAAKATEAGLQKQLTAETERGQAIKKAGEETIPKLKEKADLADAASKNATRMVKDPAYRAAQDHEAALRKAAVNNATRLARQMGMTFTPGADETSADINARMALARARSSRGRGMGIDRVLTAGDAKAAAKAADDALKAADAKLKADIASSAASLKVIENNMKNLAVS